jgi:hypothetical protein
MFSVGKASDGHPNPSPARAVVAVNRASSANAACAAADKLAATETSRPGSASDKPLNEP